MSDLMSKLISILMSDLISKLKSFLERDFGTKLELIFAQILKRIYKVWSNFHPKSFLNANPLSKVKPYSVDNMLFTKNCHADRRHVN